ncbi:MAG: hypothetical protein ACPIOQ_16520, partial [Promethearchaeia archaeon]
GDPDIDTMPLLAWSLKQAQSFRELRADGKDSPFVKFMIDNMHKRGCRVDEKDFFVVRHCDEKVGGGFDESASKHGGVVLCQNHIRDYNHTGAHGGMRARCCCGASTEGTRDCMHSVMTR